jgi:Planctomycete cytochrome C
MTRLSRRAASLYSALALGALLLAAAVSRTGMTAVTAATDAQQGPTAKQVEFFEKSIRPILTNHCYDCHSARTKPSGGLRLDDRDALLAGGKSGPAVVLGNPDESLISTATPFPGRVLRFQSRCRSGRGLARCSEGLA